MFLQILLFIFLLGLFIFYWYGLRRQQTFWRKRGIPGPTPDLVKGNLDNVFGENPSVLQLQRWTKEFGCVYGIQEGWFNVLVTSDPEMVRQLLVDKFEYFHGRLISPLMGDVDRTELIHLFAAQGKRWKRLRTIATPAFSLGNLKRVMPILDDSIRATMDLLEEARCKGKPINMHIFLTEMTFDIISRVAMGQQDSRQFHSPHIKMAQKCFSKFNNSRWDYYALLFPWIGRNFLAPFLLAVGTLWGDPVITLMRTFFEAVKERKQQNDRKNDCNGNTNGQIGEGEEEMNGGKKGVDFIDLFLESESNVQLTHENKAYNKMEKFERKNSIEEIVMNCFLFLLAGFDTTANSLSVISHNLAMHPEVQRKLWEEIDSICVDDEPTYEQLAQLKYADSVIKETLRLCPIGAAVVNRIAAEPISLGNIKLEKGTVVKADLMTLHRDKSIWGEDAHKFRPERWLDSNFVQPSAYYPFGGGPRICIGMRLAMLEEKMALVHLMRRFSLNKCPETEANQKKEGEGKK